jgi:hypothetical protein
MKNFRDLTPDMVSVKQSHEQECLSQRVKRIPWLDDHDSSPVNGRRALEVRLASHPIDTGVKAAGT